MGSAASTTSSSVAISDGDRARGAAELDLEYYARSLVGGNRKEGSVLPSKPPEVPPPRRLNDPLLKLLLSDFSDPTAGATCLPVVALVDELLLKEKNDLSSPTRSQVERDIQNRVIDYRDKVRRSFAARAQWREDSVSDQYYFDLTAYALWRTAADLLPNYEDRDRFARRLGNLLYSQCKKVLGQTPPLSKTPLTSSIPSIKTLLDLFVTCGFCKSYRIGEKPKADSPIPVFDEFDDETLATGGSVDCLVSIFEPATLGASLQITGEQSRFSPDYVGATLAALWEDAVSASSLEGSGRLRVSWEAFFVDNSYRSNPKDYFPDEQLYQFTLVSKSK